MIEKQVEIDASGQSDDHRTLAREAQAAFRERRRHGMVLVQIAVSRTQAAALERLGLYDPDAGTESLGWAVARYLDTARPVAAIGDALYPDTEGWEA